MVLDLKTSLKCFIGHNNAAETPHVSLSDAHFLEADHVPEPRMETCKREEENTL